MSYPELYTYAMNKKKSVNAFLQSNIQDMLWLPLSMTAANELNDLHANLPLIDFNSDERDIWAYIWGNKPKGLSAIDRNLYYLALVSMDVEILLLK